jgi:iron complex outermembrane receptor protein
MYMEIGEMTVTGKSSDLSAADAPASVDVIGADQIEMQNVDFSMELLKKVPGFYYGDWNQGVVSGTVSLRGFDANHDAPATLIVDGIPHNFGYGKMDIQPFFPLEIDHIEAVKGTTDPRYGLLNIAGNINLHTKRGGNFTEGKFLTGSFNTYDAGLITSHDNGQFSQTYFVGYRTTDGYRDHSDLEKGAASGKWFYTTEDKKLSLGAIARVFSMDADAPGYLEKDEADSDPTKAADFATSDGGEQDNHHISTHLDFAFSDDLIWSFKAYHQRIERTRWCKWSDEDSQQERYNDSEQYGAISTLSYELIDTFIPRLKLDWGVDYQHQDNIEARWDSENRRREGDATWYYDMDFYYWGSYVQADGDITDWLRLTASLRVDSFDGEMTNR